MEFRRVKHHDTYRKQFEGKYNIYIYGTKDLGAFLGFWYPNAAAPLPLPFPFDSGTAGITPPSPPTLAGAAAFETGAAFGSGAARETPELNPAWLMKRCAPCRRD